jgi:DNA-binding NarL/FixJ family response regulator
MGVTLCAMGCRVKRQAIRPGLQFPDRVLCEGCARSWARHLEQAKQLHRAAELPPWLRAEVVAFWWAAGKASKWRGVESRAVPKGITLYQKPERDRLILAAMAKGSTNPQIAKSLGLTHGTVRVYVSELLTELGARTRTAAIMEAIHRGLIDAPSRARK